jgi:hypothetical protein
MPNPSKLPNYFVNLTNGQGQISDPWWRSLNQFHSEATGGFTLQTGPGISSNLTSVGPSDILILNNTGVLSLLSAQPPAGLHITNSSNTGTITQTFTLADDLLALESLNGTGFGVRTGTSAWANRNIQGTTNRISLTNGDGISNNPIIDISSSYIGQSSITILGLITSGTWNGSVVGVNYGGTGVNTSTGTGSVVLNISPNLITPNIGIANGTSLTVSGSITAVSTITTPGSILSSGGGIGYGVGAGGSVAQSTSKSTGVVLNKGSGQITMNAAALLPTTSVSFTLTNSLINISDVIITNIKSGATVGSYQLQVDGVNTGSCVISLRNQSSISMSESVVINFCVIKGSST